MAIRFRINIEAEELRDELRRLEAAGEDLSAPLDEIGGYVTAETQSRFERGHGPDGRAWPPSIRVQMHQGGQTLVDTGRLRDSITWRATRRAVTIGSNVVYAAIHQLGGRIRARSAKALKFHIPGVGWRTTAAVNIPARPFLGINAGDRREIVDILRDHLAPAGGN